MVSAIQELVIVMGRRPKMVVHQQNRILDHSGVVLLRNSDAVIANDSIAVLWKSCVGRDGFHSKYNSKKSC